MCTISRRKVLNTPMDTSERPLVEMRSDVDQNVVPTFVDLLTARDIATELFEEFAFVRQLASEREEPPLVVFSPLIA